MTLVSIIASPIASATISSADPVGSCPGARDVMCPGRRGPLRLRAWPTALPARPSARSAREAERTQTRRSARRASGAAGLHRPAGLLLFASPACGRWSLGLDLAHTLARQAELLADRLERGGTVT